jgi:hypothetical protein
VGTFHHKKEGGRDMRKTVVLIAAMALLFSSVALFAQGTGAWSVGSPADVPGLRLDGSEIVANVEGTVTKIEAPAKAPKYLVMYLKTEGGKVTVWMGPKTFVESQKVKFKAGDVVVVRGLQTKHFYTIASKITKGDEVMVLRSEAGQPAWKK